MLVKSACCPEHSKVSDVTKKAINLSDERASGEGEVWGEGSQVCLGAMPFKDR